MIKALMIDVDGVLVCGRPSDGRPWRSTIEHDLGLADADLRREFFSPHWTNIVTGRDGLFQRLEPVLAKIAPHLSCDDFIAYWFENDARLNTKLLQDLGEYRKAGIKIFLATNQEHHRASYLKNRLGLAQHCDAVFYSAALGYQKPDHPFFERAAIQSGFAPDQLLLIDDTPPNVVAARSAGWHAVEWLKESSLKEELAEFDFFH